MPLTAKQRKFAEIYDGNGTEAARKAGYSAKSENALAQIARGLLRNTQVAKLIRAREVRTTQPLTASREARQAFWASVTDNPEVDWRDRLRASELLGKSNADFTEKILHSGHLTLEQMVQQSFVSLSPSTTPPELPSGEAPGTEGEP